MRPDEHGTVLVPAARDLCSYEVSRFERPGWEDHLMGSVRPEIDRQQQRRRSGARRLVDLQEGADDELVSHS